MQQTIAPSGPFVVKNGPFHSGADEQGAFRYFVVGDDHLNRMGVCHGGWLSTFADVLMGAAGRAYLEDGELLTISLQIDFVAAARLGDKVVGRAQVVKNTSTMMFLRGTATVGGDPVLGFSGIFKKPRRPR